MHADTLERKAIELCRAAASIINRQLVRPLVLWNFVPGRAHADMELRYREKKRISPRAWGSTPRYWEKGCRLPRTTSMTAMTCPLPGEGDEILQPTVNAPQDVVQERTTSAFAEATEAERPCRRTMRNSTSYSVSSRTRQRPLRRAREGDCGRGEALMATVIEFRKPATVVSGRGKRGGKRSTISEAAKDECACAIALVVRSHFSEIGEDDLVHILGLAGVELGMKPMALPEQAREAARVLSSDVGLAGCNL